MLYLECKKGENINMEKELKQQERFQMNYQIDKGLDVYAEG